MSQQGFEVRGDKVIASLQAQIAAQAVDKAMLEARNSDLQETLQALQQEVVELRKFVDDIATDQNTNVAHLPDRVGKAVEHRDQDVDGKKGEENASNQSLSSEIKA